MNYLLDTHVFLWMLADPGKLSVEAVGILKNPDRTVFVSAVTAVEIAIKSGLRKLQVQSDLLEEIGARGLRELPLRYVHGRRLQSLAEHHSDPFDRMLIAQAVEEDLVIVTHDKKFADYPVKIVWT